MDISQRIAKVLRQHKVYTKALCDELVKVVSGDKNIFALYEQEIGLLTPMVAEMLGDAMDEYPEDWIKQAFNEAVKRNARNWSYIAKILQNRKNNNGFVGKKTGEELSLADERKIREAKMLAELRKYGIDTD